MESEVLIYAGVGLVALLILGFMLTRLYVRATKETAFVRTGMGGERVVLNGGALVFPVLHETIRVGMTTTALEVRRENNDSLITSDSMLVNVHAQFFVRVAPTVEAISAAAQTLGRRTLDPSALKQFIEGKFVDALRNVAAKMTLDELNQERAKFVQQVQATCQHDLAANGLQLESVSLTGLVQADKQYFNPDNALHAQGLTELTRRTSERAVVRNQIETDTRVQTETKTAETDKASLAIAQDLSFARLDQDKQVKERTAKQEAEIAEIEANRDAEAAAARSRADQATREAAITSEQQVQLAEQRRDIAVANASRDQSQAAAEADAARAQAVKAAQQVITAERVATAEREKEVQLVAARQEAEQQAIGVTVQANAERDAAQARAEALRLTAEGEANAITIKAEAQRVTYEVEATGQRLVIEAQNLRSTAVMDFENRAKLLSTLPQIIRESVEPLKNIDRISIADFGGALGGQAYGGGAPTALAGDGTSSLADQVTSAALRYRAQAPLVDSLMGELGLNLSNVAGLTAPVVPTSPQQAARDARMAPGETLVRDTPPAPLRQRTQRSGKPDSEA